MNAEPRRGVIEIVARSGQVRQRVPYRGGNIRVGRAYDNDVIVEDRFACPHHLVIEPGEDGLLVRDLGSINGLWVRDGRLRVETVVLADHGEVQFGHSRLRFRSAEAPVPATWRDTTHVGAARWLGRPWLPPVALLLAFLALMLNDAASSTGSLRVGVLLTGLLYPVVGLMLWSGVWALLNRLLSQRARFGVHLSIASLGLTAVMIAGEAVPLLGFALGRDEWVQPLELLLGIVIFAVVLFHHLQFATHGPPKRQAAASMAVAATLVLAPALGAWLSRDEFSSLPELKPLLKPPVFRVREGVAPSAFFEAAESLRAEVDDAAAEEPLAAG